MFIDCIFFYLFSGEQTLESTKLPLLYPLDTHSVVKRLQHKPFYPGFSEAQAEEIKDILVDVMQINVDHMNKNLVTKPQQVFINAYYITFAAALRRTMRVMNFSLQNSIISRQWTFSK